jgi:Xaa-Pro aminopeptidase
MRFLALTACALLFALPAKADKFWLTDPAAQKTATPGSSPELIEGVLIAESDEGYHVRVVGGELLLPKQSVCKIEKDDLSLDAIVKAERAAAEQSAAAERERVAAQQAAKNQRELQAMEAAARRSAAAVPAPAAAANVVRGPTIQQDLVADAQLAYELTRDRRYLRVLRQLRRLR